MSKNPTPAKKSRGRPRLDDQAETVPFTIRMTMPQRDKVVRLGGAAWIRNKIDRAKEPDPND